MAEVKVEARPNGPYVVTGSIEFLDTWTVAEVPRCLEKTAPEQE